MTISMIGGHDQRLDDFLRRAHLGFVRDHSIAMVIGDVASIATAPVVTPICTAGLWQTPTAATLVEFASSSANDSAAGTGARSVTMTALDADWEYITQTKTTNGTGQVAFDAAVRRVLDFRVASAGAYADPNPVAGIGAGSNAGTITLRTVGGGANTTWAQINTNAPRGYGRSHIGAYCIPAGYRGAVIDAIPKISGGGGGYGLIINEHPETISAPFSASIMEDLDRAIVDSASDYGSMRGPFAGPCDLTWVAYAHAGTPSASVRARILLERIAT